MAAGLGCPVVLKILSPHITHKSDVRGVVVALHAPAAVREAAETMLERVRASVQEACIDGFTVQTMVERPGAYELIIGMIEDKQFGPAILFGEGGTRGGRLPFSLALSIRVYIAAAAIVGAGERPIASADGDTAQRSLRGVVAETDPAVVEEAGESGPALKQVIDGVRRLRLRRQPRALGAQPGFEVFDQRAGSLVADGAALLGRAAVDLAPARADHRGWVLGTRAPRFLRTRRTAEGTDRHRGGQADRCAVRDRTSACERSQSVGATEAIFENPHRG